MREPPPSPALRGALVGYGFIGSQGHLPAYLRHRPAELEIVAVADICPARRELAHRALPSARIHQDFDALLASDDRLDFLDICCPPSQHHRMVRAGLERGLHVICEKPLTVSLPEAADLLSLAASRGRVLLPVQNYLRAPVVRAVADVLASGQIGSVRSVTLSTLRNTHAKGVPEWNTHWRRERRVSGGGIAMDHGAHSSYLTFEWMGGYPTSITAKSAILEPDRGDAEDNFNAVLTFPNGLASIHLSWTAGIRKVLYGIQGSRGAITVDDDELQVAHMRSTRGPDVAQGAVDWSVERRQVSSDWMDASHTGWFDSVFDDFVRAVRSEQWVGREARDAYRCMEVIETAYRSVQLSSRELPLGCPWPAGVAP